MKPIVKRVLGISLLCAVLTFAWGCLHRFENPANAGHALDFAVLVAAVSLFLQSVIGLLINNFAWLAQEKDFFDFWSRDMFEYLYKPEAAITEPWRIARGRFLLYALLMAGAFGLSAAYSWVRPFLRI